MLSVPKISLVNTNKISLSQPSFGIGRKTDSCSKGYELPSASSASLYIGETVAEKADSLAAKANMLSACSKTAASSRIYKSALCEFAEANEYLFDLKMSDSGIIYDNENDLEIILNVPVVRYFDTKNDIQKIMTINPDNGQIEKIEESTPNGEHNTIERTPKGIKVTLGKRYLEEGVIYTSAIYEYDKNGTLRTHTQDIVNKKTESKTVEKTGLKRTFDKKTGLISGAQENIKTSDGESKIAKQFIFDKNGKLAEAHEHVYENDEFFKAGRVYKFECTDDKINLVKYARNYQIVK